MIRLRNISKTYRTEAVLTTALDQVDLDIAPGDYVAITGPSGCGKSTLLGVLGLLDAPSQGQYWFDGQEVSRWSERELSALRRQRIGFVFQSFNLIDELSVEENVALALDYQGLGRREQRLRVAQALDRLGLSHRARHRPAQLSGGQQQRCALARALAGNPALLLADEPTGNLDSANGQEVMQLLRQLNDEGTTLVVVTHDALHAAQAQRTVRLLDGRVLVDALAA
ncbi:ABC transporter ATP-binding protein [Roseateles sp. BYS180W]|uniref:ABC transporter ATP-binding protein n=1 Tax=Roseateles rivi TaxID=3299028 RepID=A0ABW7FU78_9BURK